MPFLVNYLIFCVPTLHINDYRNGDIVLNTLITEFITLCVKHHMTGKVPNEYYGAAEPPVRCGVSHLSGLTEPPVYSYSA